MKKYTPEHMLNDQYPISKIRQVRRSSTQLPCTAAITLCSVHNQQLYVVQKTRTCDSFALGKATFILVYDVRMYTLTPKADDR